MANNLRFERRDLLKSLMAVPAAALIPGGAEKADGAPMSEMPSEVESASDGYAPKVLTPHEWKTVHILCEMILPADARSMSAAEAGVPAFIDDWLDFKRGDLLDEIRGGLTWLDIESRRQFDLGFVDCDRTQQKAMLDRIAFPEKAAPQDVSEVAFFNRLRDLVLSGFYTSSAGIRDLPYLGNEPLSEWTGCPPAALAKLGLKS